MTRGAPFLWLLLAAAPTPPVDDAALSRSAAEVDEKVQVERGRATRLQARARAEEYDRRLEALEARPETQERARAVRAQLVAAWTASAETLTRQWPIDPTRGCRNESLTFDSALGDADPARRAATLPEARTRLTNCLDRARLVIDAVERSSGQLEKALAAADQLLAGSR
jgi:hypothetical protein